MHIFLTLLGIYIAGIIAVPFIDAYIGIGNDSDKPDNRIPLPAICFFWPLILPIAGICTIADKLDSAKKKRIAHERQIEKIRVASELEEEKILKQVEEELANETKASNKA